MNEKMKVEMEFDRDEVAAAMMFINEKLTDERWHKLTNETITLDYSIAEEQSLAFKLAIINFAIASIKLK